MAPGSELTLTVGTRDDDLFSGEVTAVEWEQTPERTLVVRVRAYDALHQLRHSQRLETYTDADLERWARTLAGTPWSDAFVYFMHEPTAPAYAATLMRL
jgi:hypothetical protein